VIKDTKLDWWAGLINRLVVRVGGTLMVRLWLGSLWVWEAPAETLGHQHEAFGVVAGSSGIT